MAIPPDDEAVLDDAVARQERVVTRESLKLQLAKLKADAEKIRKAIAALPAN